VKKIYLLCAGILFVMLSACKKDAPDFTGYDLSNLPGATTGDPIEGNYQPVTKDSYWKYASADLGSDPDTTTTIMLGTTATYDGKSFKVASNKFASETETGTINFYHSGYTYSVREISETDTSEILYLKADAAVGATWNADLYNPATDSKGIGKIIEKGITKVVKGKTFNNVVHTRVELQVKESTGLFTTASTVDFYIAKDVGIIEEDVAIFGITGKTELFDYSIK